MENQYFSSLFSLLSLACLPCPQTISIIVAKLLKHISVSHINSTMPSGKKKKKRPSLLKHLFLRMQKCFPGSLPVASPLHIICLNHMSCPCLNQLLARDLEPVYSGVWRRKVTWTKSSLFWQRRWCKTDAGERRTVSASLLLISLKTACSFHLNSKHLR